MKAPHLAQVHEKAKLKSLISISASLDPKVSELVGCLDIVRSALSIPNCPFSVFTDVVKSTSTDVFVDGQPSNLDVFQNCVMPRPEIGIPP